jgi:hypothetical protein
LKNVYFSSTRPKFRLVNLILVYIQLNLAPFELINKKLYIYLSHFVKFGTWNFPILMEMVFKVILLSLDILVRSLQDLTTSAELLESEGVCVCISLQTHGMEYAKDFARALKACLSFIITFTTKVNYPIHASVRDAHI